MMYVVHLFSSYSHRLFQISLVLLVILCLEERISFSNGKKIIQLHRLQKETPLFMMSPAQTLVFNSLSVTISRLKAELPRSNDMALYTDR